MAAERDAPTWTFRSWIDLHFRWRFDERPGRRGARSCRQKRNETVPLIDRNGCSGWIPVRRICKDRFEAREVISEQFHIKVFCYLQTSDNVNGRMKMLFFANFRHLYVLLICLTYMSCLYVLRIKLCCHLPISLDKFHIKFSLFR